MQSLKLFSSPCDIIDEPAALVDGELRFVSVNDKLKQLTGCNGIISSPLSVLFSDIGTNGFSGELRSLINDGRAATLNATIAVQDGQKYAATVGVVPEKDGALLIIRSRTPNTFAEFESSLRQFQPILDQMSDAMLMSDSTSEVKFANQKAKEVLKFAADRPVPDRSEWTFKCLYPDGSAEVPQDELPMVRAIHKGETLHNVEILIRHDDDSETLLSVNAAPLISPEGAIYGGIAAFRDITRSRRRQREIEEANQQLVRQAMELLEMNRHKDEFLSILSHELRTPLTPVLGWVHFMRKVVTDKSLIEGLNTIDRNVQAEIRLINDLLDLTRIRSGKLALNFQRFFLKQVIGYSVEVTKDQASEKDVAVAVDLDPTIELYADSLRLNQIFVNLLTNAIKFNREHGKVTITARRDGDDAVVTVSDTGIGIEPSFLPFVFDRFRQADSTTARRFGGLGIGLTIVKLLTERHGGSVSVDSPGPDSGSSFTVRLPVASVNAGVSTDGELQKGMEFDTSSLQVLVVDDVPDTLAMMKVLLSGECKVTTASSGEMAIDLAKREPFDLIFLDIGMPGMDGFEVFTALKQIPSLRRVPIVAMTGFADEASQEKIRKLNFDGALIKPVDVDLLKTALKRAVAKKYA
ncbi:MAG TPA: ATP-binding protein [Blastocatellia bacterium]|nr:ATP-binding protein [Blastocatellia bacterium]